MGSLASDFGFTSVPGIAGGQTIIAGGVLPFTAITNTPAGSNISVVNPGSTVNAGVRIASTGFYQVTWGYTVMGGTPQFTLEVNGVVSATNVLQANGQTIMGSLTNIVQVTVNPTTLTVVNTGGANASIRNAGNNTNIVAYLTIIKLQ